MTMKKIRNVMLGLGVAGLLGAQGAYAAQTVDFWYHLDNPENTKLLEELVKDFEAKNPDIKIKAQNIPWNSYFDKLYTSIIGNQAPDVAMTRLSLQPQLIEMDAIEPLDARLEKWPGKADLADNILNINKAADGKHYYLPIHYVVIYLYYRADLFDKAGLKPPATCEEFLAAAQKLTVPASANNGVEQYGFGMRGGKGGQDNWGPFVLPKVKFEKGGFSGAEAIAANGWYIDLFRKHKVAPPSAPNDGFNEILSTFKSGRTAMIFHHIGSSKTIDEALGDKVSAVPVPTACGGGRWTYFGDESTVMFKKSKVKDAAWKWMTFLSEGENNVKFTQATGQVTVTKSGADKMSFAPRFMKATVESLPFAGSLPAVPETADFLTTAWPVNMQRALIGELNSEQMMKELDKHFFK